MRSVFVSIIGRPNVGKSTLLNAIVGQKIAITSKKPQTTRNIIEGIYNKNDIQMVFVDTPGIHKPKDRLGSILNNEAYYSLRDVDVILFLVDASEDLGKGDNFIIDKLKNIDKPVMLLLNKIDKLVKEELVAKIEEYKDLYPFKEIVPISALKKNNVERLLGILEEYLEENVQYYDTDIITNSSSSFIIAELIREKIFKLTEDEIPYATMCVVEEIKRKKDTNIIKGTIIIDRENLRKIILGKRGETIKKIGTAARIDIEKYLNTKVYLELFVKVIENWSEKEEYLRLSNITNYE